MIFWLIIGAITLIVTLLLSRSLLRPSGSPTSSADTPVIAHEVTLNSDMKVYRDQLKELDRDLVRGTINKDEAERTRLEISRRLLDADKAAQAAHQPSHASRAVNKAAIIACALVLFGSSFGLYWTLGAPGMENQGRQKRIEQAQEMRNSRASQLDAEAAMAPWPGPPKDAPQDYLDLIQNLRDALKNRPSDPQGLLLLAQHESAIGNMVAAREAMEQLIEAKGQTATANEFTHLAELMINAAGGFVSPDAERMLKNALERDPDNQIARYFTGLLFAQNGRPDMGFRMWKGLLEEGPETAIWWTSVRAQIEGLAAHAGVQYTPPAAPSRRPAARGPDASDVEAAQDMSDEERQAMIQSMINQLSERLSSEGGTPEEWARLISVLSVVGDTERANAIWLEAKDLFATHPEALATVQAAAQQAGLDQ